MLYQTAKVKNALLVIASSKEIDQSQLTSDCWTIQINGLSACNKCRFLNTPDCGGKKIRKQLLKSQ